MQAALPCWSVQLSLRHHAPSTALSIFIGAPTSLCTDVAILRRRLAVSSPHRPYVSPASATNVVPSVRQAGPYLACFFFSDMLAAPPGTLAAARLLAQVGWGCVLSQHSVAPPGQRTYTSTLLLRSFSVPSSPNHPNVFSRALTPRASRTIAPNSPAQELCRNMRTPTSFLHTIRWSPRQSITSPHALQRAICLRSGMGTDSR